MLFITFLFKNLLRRKTRTLLTSFGIAVAIGTTVALLGISDGFESETRKAFEIRGVDIVVLEKGKLDQLGSDLDEKWLDRVRQISGVKEVAPGLIDLVPFEVEGTTISCLVQGWLPNSFLFKKLEIGKGGRKLRKGDGKVAMLGVITAANLKKEVGDTVSIDEEPLEVVGIYESFSVFENGGIVVPLSTLQEIRQRKGRVTGFSVVLEHSMRTEKNTEKTVQQINDLRNGKGKLVLSAMDTKKYVENSMHIKLAHAMALLTSVIAIVVGAIGMLNTMVMSVVERVREISILRAIGWRKMRVVSMIVGESLLLSFFGAVLGVCGALLLTHWLTTLPAVSGLIQGSIASTVIAKGFLMALGVGLIGGSYPAYRATQMLPSEGLRHE